jgi:hypothetical protein
MTDALAVASPIASVEVAALQLEAEADAAEILSAVIVTDAEGYEAADELLSDIARREDAALAMRRSATVPAYQSIKTIEGWFKPWLGALGTAKAHLKTQLGNYRLRQAEVERQARLDAAALAEAGGNGDELIQSLTLAAEAAEKPAGRATASFGWRVARIAADMLPAEWLCPDVARIEGFAKAHKGDEAPVIPGVTFERVAKIGARR